MALAEGNVFKKMNKIYTSKWEDSTTLQFICLQICEVQNQKVGTLFRYPRFGMFALIVFKALSLKS